VKKIYLGLAVVASFIAGAWVGARLLMKQMDDSMREQVHGNMQWDLGSLELYRQGKAGEAITLLEKKIVAGVLSLTHNIEWERIPYNEKQILLKSKAYLELCPPPATNTDVKDHLDRTLNSIPDEPIDPPFCPAPINEGK